MISDQVRAFRCMKCKLVSRSVPFNAFNVKCGNCGKLFAYKEIREYTNLISEVIKDELLIKKNLEEQEALLEQMETSTNAVFREKKVNYLWFIYEISMS